MPLFMVEVKLTSVKLEKKQKSWVSGTGSGMLKLTNDSRLGILAEGL